MLHLGSERNQIFWMMLALTISLYMTGRATHSALQTKYAANVSLRKWLLKPWVDDEIMQSLRCHIKKLSIHHYIFVLASHRKFFGHFPRR
jgi:hypothetical protein